MWNHSQVGQRSLEDVIGIMGHQIRAMKHKCVWDTNNDKFLTREAGINIIVEGFTPHTVAQVAAAAQQGARFVILATEEPTYKGDDPSNRDNWIGFNQGTQEEMVRRMFMFPEAAKFVEGIIHLVPGDHVTAWYSQFAPTAYTELGYADSLVRITRDEPTFDFGFYGSLSPRRLKILKTLAKRIGTQKAVRVVADFTTQMERDKAMRQARVIVQLRKFDKMGLVSSSRCNTALCLGRPVIAEPHDLSKPWDEIVRFSDSMEGFFNMAILVRTMWQGIFIDQFEKFKAKLSPQDCVGQAFAKIGIPLA